MPVDPAQAKQLADAGGWAAFLVLCGFLGVGFVRGWIVPGWAYREKAALVDKLTVQLDRNTEALAKLLRAVTRRERPGRRDADT